MTAVKQQEEGKLSTISHLIYGFSFVSHMSRENGDPTYSQYKLYSSSLVTLLLTPARWNCYDYLVSCAFGAVTNEPHKQNSIEKTK